MDDDMGITLCCVTLLIIGFVVGMSMQASHCYKMLTDGREYVAIKRNDQNEYYYLGDKLATEPKKLSEPITHEVQTEGL